MNLKSLLILIIFGTLFLYNVPCAHAEGISIGDGVNINLDNGVINLNCVDINVKSGGTLNMESGRIEQCRELMIDNGGIFISGIGTITYCRKVLPAILLLLDD